ncbi:hypothetical protein [Nocardia pseudobrasiliensis]|uniref:Phage terminase large subunit-like protein n=1 Tax=Nocardia pseudobrasiliensis TaxID=45979 RepID=A0A370I4S1_9NOCA|nr:hypothetical protein [Nocardia pseudobrasiliensis]RDI65748.1 phage terminase large subunit-like protein [Nocardia pseudobrasiliensis]
MPVEVVKPRRSSRSCSLGWLAINWIESLVVHGAGDVVGMPVELIDDQAAFLLDTYALAAPGEPDEGRRLVDEVLMLAPKGADKSGLAARMLMWEAIGPSRFDGWAKGGEVYRDPWGLGFEYEFQPGEPLGRPVDNPFIRCLATAADQSSNTYESILYNFRDGPLSEAMRRRDNAGITRIVLPEGGEIIPSTASGSSKDGGRETAANADETHLYVLPELKNMFRVVNRNLRKRAKFAEPLMIATSTYYDPADGSICQEQHELALKIRAGKVKNDRLLLHYRYGDIEPADLGDTPKLRAALAEAYGGAAKWMDLDALVTEVQDPRNPVEASYRYFLNSPSTASNAWLSPWEWARCGPIDDDLDTHRRIEPGDVIVLGFDGSRKRKRGITDSTALIGCRVSDGCLFEVKVWEQPPGHHPDGWEVDTTAVDAAVEQAFRTYNVVGFYADPALWETYVAKWEAKYGARLLVKSTQPHPIEWWMTGARAFKTVEALRKFQDAVLDGELCHDGSPILTQHVLNARRFASTKGVQIRKEHPDSANKIDAAVAATLAWQARLDAVAKGIGGKKRKRIAVRVR